MPENEAKNLIIRMLKDKCGDNLVNILRKYKQDNPTKNDYGLCKAGYLPYTTEDRREMLRKAGYTALLDKKPKEIGNRFTRLVAECADEILFKADAAERGDTYLGHYCYAGTVNEFLSLRADEWLKLMKSNALNTHPVPPSTSQIHSWQKSRTALSNALRNQPKLSDFTIIFEYVMPMGNNGNVEEGDNQIGRRADVIILGRDKVLIFEFKDRNREDIKIFATQASAYKTRIENMHVESRTNEKFKVLSYVVLLADENYHHYDSDTECDCYSKDMLDDLFNSAFGEKPRPHLNPEKWINSRWLASR